MNARTWLRAEWDRVAGYGFISIGALLLVAGYLGVRSTAFTTEALAYIASGGLGGLFCLGLGVGLLLSADLHDEWRKLDRIEAAFRGAPLPDSKEVLDLTTRSAASGAETDAPPSASSTSGERPSAKGTACQIAAPPLGTTSGTYSCELALPPDRDASGFRRATAVACLALLMPVGAMGAGWRVTARTTDVDVASNALKLAIIGLILAIVAVSACVIWFRKRVVDRTARLLAGPANVIPEAGAKPASFSPRQGETSGLSSNSEVLVIAGLRRYHRSGCPTLSSHYPVSIDRSELSSDHSPCGICGAT